MYRSFAARLSVAVIAVATIGCGKDRPEPSDRAPSASAGARPDATAEPPPRPGLPMRLEEALLATIPGDEEIDAPRHGSRFFRPDGGAVAFTTGDGASLYRDGARVEGYDRYEELGWTRAGALTFVGESEAPGQSWVVVGDSRYGPYGSVGRVRVDDADGVWFVASPGLRRRVLVHDGVAGEPFRRISPSDIATGPDGRVVAFRAKRDAKTACVVVRGEAACSPGVGRPVVSADGRVVAYVAITAKDRAHAVIGGVAGPTWDDVWWDIALSDDGAVAAYVAKRDGRQRVVHRGVEGRAWDRVMDLAMSHDGERVAYRAREGERWKVVVRDEEHAVDGVVDDLRVTRDGRHAAWIELPEGRLGGRPARVVVDGERGPVERCARFIDLSEDGRVAYVACDGEAERMVVDGRRGPSYRDVGAFQRAPSGDGWAYVANGPDGLHIVTRDASYGPYDEISGGRGIAGHVPYNYVWTPDGRAVVFRGSRGGSWHVVVAGVEGPPADAVYLPVSFSVDGRHVGYGARVGDQLRWRVAELPSP